MAREFFFPTVQGSILKTVDLINNAEPKTKAMRLLQKKYENRFFRDHPIYPPVKHQDPWVRQVIRTYHEYFVEVLTERMTSEAAEKWLVQCLRERAGVTGSSMEEIEAELQQGFEARNLHFFGGRTSPHYGPYI